MKKMFTVVLLVGMLALGALSANAVNVFGFIYKNTTEPGSGYTTVNPSRAGTATCISWFGIAARGNCSVYQAMRNGGVHSLTGYDVHTKNVLGYQRITIKAFGN